MAYAVVLKKLAEWGASTARLILNTFALMGLLGWFGKNPLSEWVEISLTVLALVAVSHAFLSWACLTLLGLLACAGALDRAINVDAKDKL